jgi:hypothetical protein
MTNVGGVRQHLEDCPLGTKYRRIEESLLFLNWRKRPSVNVFEFDTFSESMIVSSQALFGSFPGSLALSLTFFLPFFDFFGRFSSDVSGPICLT